MHGAVALPQQHAARGQTLLGLTAPSQIARSNLHRPRIPNRHLVQRNPHRVPCVAPQMLIRQKQNSLAARKCPLHSLARARRRAHQAAMLAAKRLDRRGRVDIGHGNRLVREPRAFQRLPAVFHLRDFRHIGHRAARVQVGQNHLLAVSRQNVGALGHKVHAAKHNVLGARRRGRLRQLVAVAGEVGKAHHLVALVMVAQNHGGRAQLRARRGNALVHRVVGQRQIVFQRAGRICLRGGSGCFVKNQVSQYSAFSPYRTGMLKAFHLAAVSAFLPGPESRPRPEKDHQRGCCSPCL